MYYTQIVKFESFLQQRENEGLESRLVFAGDPPRSRGPGCDIASISFDVSNENNVRQEIYILLYLQCYFFFTLLGELDNNWTAVGRNGII